jgi:cytochrome c oxidase assembly factor 1
VTKGTETETFNAKARPTSVHASPDSTEGRAYIPPSSRLNTSTVKKALEQSGVEERFTGPARLRNRYERPKEARDLPGDTSRWRYCTSPHPHPLSASTNLLYISFGRGADLAVAAFAITVWSLFLLHVTNAERLSSSVLRQITYQLRNSEEVKRAIGAGVRYADNWWGE